MSLTKIGDKHNFFTKNTEGAVFYIFTKPNAGFKPALGWNY